MQTTSKTLFGAAAMLALASSIATTQDTSKARPRSSTRIPISKEAPGEVTTRRIDTVTMTVYKTDTLRINGTTRVDTVSVTNTVVRIDTVTVAPPVPPVRLPGGFYFGLGGGVMAPNGAIYNGNNAGPSVQAQLGWQGAKNLLGVRFDANYAKPGEDAFYSGYQADPEIINLSGDLKMNLPILNHLFGISPRFNLYGIGGASYVMYKSLPIRSDVAGAGVGPANITVGDTPWLKHLGWNAGGGASLGWRRVEVFAETRVIAWTTDTNPQSRQMPFVLGLNWY